MSLINNINDILKGYRLVCLTGTNPSNDVIFVNVTLQISYGVTQIDINNKLSSY